MRTHRFGRKLKLPSTVAIKHEISKLMMQDKLKAQALPAKANEALVAHGDGAAEAASPLDEVMSFNLNPNFLDRHDADHGDTDEGGNGSSVALEVSQHGARPVPLDRRILTSWQQS
jgi:hypothetical protein